MGRAAAHPGVAVVAMQGRVLVPIVEIRPGWVVDRDIWHQHDVRKEDAGRIVPLDWTAPFSANLNSSRGHQFLPALSFALTWPLLVVGFVGTLNPSAGYAPIDANIGVGPWSLVPGGTGAAKDDGFTSYKSQVGNPPRTRWGDYGAAAVDGNSVWIASAACHSARRASKRASSVRGAG